MQQTFILISTVLTLISPLVYSRAILSGKAKPHRTTRFVLLLITALTTASLFAQHNTVAIWLAGASTVEAIIVFAFSFKFGLGGFSTSDIVCLVTALIGITLWQITKNPVVALYFAILADFMGMVPTLLKTHKQPSTEIYLFFLLAVFAGIFNLMAIQQWTLVEISYPIYIVLINLLMVCIIIKPHGRNFFIPH